MKDVILQGIPRLAANEVTGQIGSSLKMADARLRELATRAVKRIEELEQELARGEATQDTVAIVGLGCRFPGAPSPQAFWKLLTDKVCAVDPVPDDFWTDEDIAGLGAQTAQFDKALHSGMLDSPALFEPEFFGISPREAEVMDPQQRLLLEVVWHAIEDAGIIPERLSLDKTGIFLGLSSIDYALEAAFAADATSNPYRTTGIAHSIAAGRIAHVLGCGGPAIAVDTSCSSSAVSIHLARRSLLAGECDLVLAGGANRILIPHVSLQLASANMLSRSGRCQTFGAGADGYVRAEGAGILVLKRFRDAVRDQDRIYACIAGSAINQDGRSSGITVPNGRAQERVIRDAITDAGVSPEQIEYVEAHGTGTRLGDPIEARALQRVFGSHPVLIGSVKTNIGHAEAAAGVAGVIKVALAIEHGVVPGQIGPETLTPEVDWESSPVKVLTDAACWSTEDRYAGVSSFGFSGTNTHLVFCAPPQSADDTDGNVKAAGDVPVIIPVSGRSARSLQENLKSLAPMFHQLAPGKMINAAWAAAMGRRHHTHRTAVVAATPQEAAERFGEVLDNANDGSSPLSNVELSFVFHAPSGDRSVFVPFSRWSRLRELQEQRADGAGTNLNNNAPMSWSEAQVLLADFLTDLGAVPTRVEGQGGAVPAVRAFVDRTCLDNTHTSEPDSPSKVAFVAAPEERAGINGWRLSSAVGNRDDGQSQDAGRETAINFADLFLNSDLPEDGEGPVPDSAVERFVLNAVAKIFEAGGNIRWRQLFDHVPRPISLPPYYFDRRPILRRSWPAPGREASISSGRNTPRPAALRPLDSRIIATVAPQKDGALKKRPLSPRAWKAGELVQLKCFNGNTEPERLTDVLLFGREAMSGSQEPVVFEIPQDTPEEHLTAFVLAACRTFHVEHAASGLSCILTTPSAATGSVAAKTVAELESRVPVLLAEGDTIREEVLGERISPKLPPAEFWRGRRVLIIGEAFAAENLGDALGDNGAVVRRVSWKTVGEVADISSYAAVYIFLPRAVHRELLATLDGAASVAEFLALARTIDELLCHVGNATDFICLSRGAECSLGWRGRFLDTVSGEYAWTRLRHEMPSGRLVCLDWPLLQSDRETPEELDRLLRHGISRVEPAREVELLLSAPHLRGRFIVDNFSIDAESSASPGLANIARILPFQAVANKQADTPSDTRSVVAAVLEVAVDDLPSDVLLTDLGMDSLMALEIQEGLKLLNGFEFDISDIMSHASIDWLMQQAAEHGK